MGAIAGMNAGVDVDVHVVIGDMCRRAGGYAPWHHTKRRALLCWRSADRTLRYMSSVVCFLIILKLP
jgi:hypothetical protein